ncbi:MAG: glycosyltransferase [Candidatus Eisenbacteria bacterium]|nr:glycosyltransferase [Candidatus Eisenbacteria bacterium]
MRGTDAAGGTRRCHLELLLLVGRTPPPVVSAVVPSYNGEAYLRECLRSIRSQTLDGLEIIVVDDGSSDSSRSIILDEAADDERIRFVEHDRNRGIAAARNTGISESRGEFVGFLDQDDVWLPSKLETQVSTLEEAGRGVEAVFSDVLMVDERGRTLGRCHHEYIPQDVNRMSREQRLRACFLHNFIPVIGLLVRRSCFDRIGLFDESIRGGMDDFELCLRLVGGADIMYIDRPLAAHRVHGGNYSQKTDRLLSDLPDVIGKAVEEFPALGPLVPRKRALLHYRLARFHRDSGRFRKAREELREAQRIDPTWSVPGLLAPLYAMGRAGSAILAVRRALRRLLVRP